MAGTMLELLAGLVEREGPEYPSREPWKVYQYLQKNEADPMQSRQVLITLLAGAVGKTAETDQEGLTRFLQKSCRLTKSAAGEMAELYRQLYSPAQTEAWDAKRCEGFRELCGMTWDFSWSGEAAWTYRGGHCDCEAELQGKLEVENPELLEKFLSKALEKNPFLTAGDLADLIAKSLRDVLDREMDEYVDEDHYYEPVMEDFDSAYYLQKECEKIGLRVDPDACETSGSTGDYEPDDYW